jgi:excisionase family DNA binding protein
MQRTEKPMGRLLYRPREVAELTGMALSYVYRLIANGELPSLRHGRLLRVSADKLHEWIRKKSG